MTMLNLMLLSAALEESEEDKKPCETVLYMKGEKKWKTAGLRVILTVKIKGWNDSP